MFNLCKSPLKQLRYKCFKDIAEAKFFTYEFIPRWVSLAALSRIFCQQLDINLEANGEQTKKISPHSRHILKKRQKIFSVLQQRHEKTTTTTKNKQTNKKTSD